MSRGVGAGRCGVGSAATAALEQLLADLLPGVGGGRCLGSRCRGDGGLRLLAAPAAGALDSDHHGANSHSVASSFLFGSPQPAGPSKPGHHKGGAAGQGQPTSFSGGHKGGGQGEPSAAAAPSKAGPGGPSQAGPGGQPAAPKPPGAPGGPGGPGAPPGGAPQQQQQQQQQEKEPKEVEEDVHYKYDPKSVCPGSPADAEQARKAKADYNAIYNPGGDDPEQTLPTVCDKMGRIPNALDGKWCQGYDACVTALPQDFAMRSQEKGDPFCWRWVAPPCTRAPCPEPYLEDQCAAVAGRPWCVPTQYIKKYRGPLEIKCSASGVQARFNHDSPTGCWWLEKYAHQDLQRLPGNIHSKHFPNGGVADFVPQSEPYALDEKVAMNWIRTGNMTEPVKEDTGSDSCGHLVKAA